MTDFLKKPLLNGWPLFWLVTGPVSLAVILAMFRHDLGTGGGVSSMIQYSVRCAVPWLFLAFAASSTVVLWPGVFSRWLLRNRKYFGLSFAAAMAWQAVFILWLVTVHRAYYVNEVYVLRDVIEGVLGYSFLVAMVITSFPWGRKPLSPKQWKVLHKVGIYSLWIYAFSVYWWELFYYDDRQPIDYIYYVAGFGAWGLRCAAWRKKRWQRLERHAEGLRPQPILMMAGLLLVALGLAGVACGQVLQQAAETHLAGVVWADALLTWLPYWPFEPFIPLFVILLGARLTLVPQEARAK